MKKFLSILMMILFFAANEIVFAATSPTCAFLKFANDTRYQNIDVAEDFSEFVIEKILAKTKINLIESRVIDENLEEMLYNEKMRNIANAKRAVKAGNLDLIFESEFFDTTRADSISTAELGQNVSPEITKKIGEKLGAEYLIHGTIINLGNGNWDGEASAEKEISSLINAVIFGGRTHTESKTATIFLDCDLRIIKADTGKIVWKKRFSAVASKTSYGGTNRFMPNLNRAKTPKLTKKMYSELLENATKSITEGLIKDFDAGKLFGR